MPKRTYTVSQETRDKVYAALELEADMDGLATIGEERLGNSIRMSGHSVAVAIRMLCAEGRISVIGFTEGRGNVRMIQLNEF